MDPLTAGMDLATALLGFGEKVWDATPPAQQILAASDWAGFTHGIGSVFLGLQAKINGVLVPTPKGV